MLDADATPLGDEVQVNEVTTGLQWFPGVAAVPGGGFVVAWESGANDPPGSYDAIRARRFDGSGTALGPELQVNSYDDGLQVAPAIAVDGSGGFVVTWASGYSTGSDTSGFSIQARRFASNGTPLGADFQVNTLTTGYQAYPAVAADAAGAFVVAWQSEAGTGPPPVPDDIRARGFDALGNPLGDDVEVSAPALYQEPPSIAGAGGSGAIVSWSVPVLVGPFYEDSIQARALHPDGTPAGSRYRVDASSGGTLVDPRVATDHDGNRVFAWSSTTSPGPDDDGWSIQARRFDQLFRDGFESGNAWRWSAVQP